MKGKIYRANLRDVTTEARKLGAVINRAYVDYPKVGRANKWRFYYGDFSIDIRAINKWHARSLGWQAWLAADRASFPA